MSSIFKKYIDDISNQSTLNKGRLKVLFISLFIIFIILTARLIFLSIYIKNDTKTIQMIYEAKGLKKRQYIVDTNGVILASDIDLVNFYLNRELVSDPEETSRLIKKIIPEINEEKLYKKLIDTKSKAKYILIRRNVTPNQETAIKKAGILGFEFNNTIARIYPHKNLFSHLIGYIDINRNGVAGIEREYDTYLKNPVDNDVLELTIDIRIQSILREQLLKAIEKYSAKSAIGIVSEIKTGNILGIVTLPDFDPNQLYNVSQEILYDKATYGVYEMGSIFKIFTIANALNQNIIREDEKFDISQIIKYGNYEIKQEEYTKKFLTAEEILMRSSNVGAALIGLRIGNEKMSYFLNLLGMFDKVPANFPSLAKPLIPKTWRDINTITVSYGHGIAVSPLHVVMAVGGIVNNGILKTPRFTKIDPSKEIKIITPETSKIMNLYLRNAVRHGTGWRANILGYSVGGKTGSARLIRNGEYQENNIMANFVGIFPMNDPHFIVYVMIESPNVPELKDNLSGGTVAAPVAGRIIENIAPILNVVPYIEQ